MEAARLASGSSADQLRHLYRFMAPRLFVASREELVDAGFSVSRIENWLRIGRLIKVVRSVYAYGRDIETAAAARRAALLTAGSGAALVGQSSCEGWGIVTPKPGLPSRMRVGVRTGRARRVKGTSPALRRTTVDIVRREFQPGDIRSKSGLRLTRPALALIDFAADASDRQVRFAFLEACRLGLFGESDVGFTFDRLFRRRGARKLRPLLALWVPELRRIRSVLEGWFLLVWIERGYAMPKVNEKVFGHEVDDYWPDRGVVLELDGDAFHSDPIQKKLDRDKQRDLEAHGLIVIRLTYRQFEADPEGEADRLALQAR